ncbi:FAD-dependent thymidylate synthase [Chloroflexi bacterium TSY]|nr:FAD-dependent thymidylate synthase [Chloroflexi bacterium TSY]
MIEAEIICDSQNKATGNRLVTIRMLYPRYIHAELMTHRVFSRNSASSRAVPVTKMIERVEQNPVIPPEWRKNQRGMQGYEILDEEGVDICKEAWRKSMEVAIEQARIMTKAGAHKQHVNRLLEPFMFIEVLVSATEWKNFLLLRDHHSAQPEIQSLAKAVRHAIEESLPTELEVGDWHLPFISAEDRENFELDLQKSISAARCARVSYYLRSGQKSDPGSDIALCDRLKGPKPMHLSPFEHVAVAVEEHRQIGNFVGFKQWRKFFMEESGGDYQF